MATTDTALYNQGRAAYEAGHPRYSKPLELGWWAAIAWLAGWDAGYRAAQQRAQAQWSAR